MKLAATLALLLLLGAGCAAPPEEPPPAAPRGISSHAIDSAVEELVQRFQERSARGWPADVALTGEPSRPTIQFTIKSTMAGPLDLERVAEQVITTLTTAGLAEVVDSAPPRVEGALDLTVSFSDEVDRGNHVYWITFTLTDPRNGAVLVATRSKSALMGAR
jgi:hypothetical protein